MRATSTSIACIFVVFLCAFSVSATEDPSNLPFVVEKVSYEIDGSTKENALRALSNLGSGVSFIDYDQMILAIERERQDLINRRVFDSVEYKAELISSRDGTKFYGVTFSIVDAFTIVPIPYPNYDSNTGFRLGLKTYWSNFLGTMTNAYLGMNINFESNTGNAKTGEWNINPTISGIRLTDRINLSISMIQSYEEADFVDTVVPADSYEYSFYSSGISFGTSIDLKKNRSYGVSLGMDFRYGYEGELGSQLRQPYAFTPSHSLSYGRIDWIENFRKGFSTSISNSYRWGKDESVFLISAVDANASYYLPFLKRFNFYTRGSAFYQWEEPRTVASSIRGVRDNLMSGYTGFIFNTSLAFQFWRFENVWDAQIHPFIDMGLVYNNKDFNYDRDFNVGFGVDLVLYLDVLPSLVAVGSIGVDPARFNSEDLFGSLEISITSSLFY